MVDGNGGDGRQKGALDDIRCVEPSAQAGLKEHDVGRMLREGEEGRCGGDLEESDRLAAIGFFGALQDVEKRALADGPGAARRADGDPFVEMPQMRRCEHVHLEPRGLQHRPQEGDDGAFAVRPRHVNDRRHRLVRIAKRRQQPLDAVERQVNRLRVKMGESRQERGAPWGGHAIRRM
jgi:hypothetical protein